MLAKERKGIILACGAGTFLAGASAALIPGDNIFHGANLSSLLQSAAVHTPGHA
jgi:hypothetical protein